MSDFDADAYRDASLAGWEAAAPGWTRRQEAIRGLGMPVSRWMLEATVSPAWGAGARAGREGSARPG